MKSEGKFDSAKEQILRSPDVSRETIERLYIYEELLLRWQKVKNLVAPSTLPELWSRHFADSLQILPLMPDAVTWVDLGSGAGFPGLVIAIQLVGKPGSSVHLVESDHRKCAFLREVARETGAPAFVHNQRIENIAGKFEKIDAVTARALASMDKLLKLSRPILEKGAIGFFLKGQDVAAELTDNSIFSSVHLELLPSATDPNAKIVRARMVDPGSQANK